ncbi:MAG: 16S rRNA (uracil(1498)-N(3))-methyltransferase [Faecalicatena sp.]|uniref:16S rRNA (uracil(1498)-N(3))-methyltransferase n=1 Tax=Faecalicatena sp. TaxID=2005360 RepID=UPI0025891E62|nr:16S rRNA (uracil(1498)-N(3))-methyltransferase [Faecalicatena sp.]MCI6465015.1 16S rRNA (uracil(1498)-N(3))-methyltransferase [Faecalicatena sp.]MDY5617154.1 16S rRNA (uracil(1498)-N(3))-methyltransferase [Lachnospiraceae bacterium]
MHHFFTEPSQIRETEIFIEGADFNHMKNVLRMKPGEKVGISDGQGTDYTCEVERFEEGAAVLHILSSEKSYSELSSRIILFQGLPKGDKMELIIQKAVELGVWEVVPVSTRRAVVKLDDKKAAKKVQRWNSIALGAAKQSGRSLVPEVKPVMSFAEALEYAGELDITLIPYEMAEGMEKTKEMISSIRPGQSIGVFIGPEGGFDEEEVEKAQDMGAFPITLGKRILRTETAGLTVLSILMFHLEQ